LKVEIGGEKYLSISINIKVQDAYSITPSSLLYLIEKIEAGPEKTLQFDNT